MICKECRHEIGPEELKCPYCGADNPFALQHKQNMKKFKKERDLREDERETRREDALERWESDFLRREAEWKDQKYKIKKDVKARREALTQELKERKDRQE